MSGKKRLIVYDTTLRDGEQAPGFSMFPTEKLALFRRLFSSGVDVVEAGFPAASPDEVESVSRICSESGNVVVSVLARSVESDIRTAWNSVCGANRPRLHIIIPSSDIQIEHQLGKTRSDVMKSAKKSMELAIKLCDDVQFSAMDATRADRIFLKNLLDMAVEEGAKTINISDTTGYALPAEISCIIKYLKNEIKNADRVCFSIHCHNDLGLATANTLTAVEAGADQVECTLAGIGERAGNAAVEELMNIILKHNGKFNVETKVDYNALIEACRYKYKMLGMELPANKPAIGKHVNAKQEPYRMP